MIHRINCGGALDTKGATVRIILIGANGQLGTDLRRQLPGEVVGLDWPQFDVRSEEQVQTAMQDHRPDLVINCAAQTNVDLCEDESAEAFAINALGAMHVARWAENVGAAVMFISTDYVFGAAEPRAEPYTEEDLPGPVNVYGAGKLAGEQLTLAYNSHALVVRTSGLYGHAGARGKGGNFVETMLRLAHEGKPIKVVHDQRLTPTATMDLATRLAALSETNTLGVLHIAARDSCTWFEFAQTIFEHKQLDVDLQPINSAEFPTRARRPAMSALASVRLEQAGITPCRSWREMLHEYLYARAGCRV